jgi:recombination protein RecR
VSQDLFDEFLDTLRCLPGVGKRSAQRMALHLLERDRDGGRRLAGTLQKAMDDMRRCEKCRNFTVAPVCKVCLDTQRDQSVLCVVESPADVLAIEGATQYNGRYFVLLGRLSPLDGIGPEQLGLNELASRLADDPITEMIIATNTTVEGEATAHYLSQMAARHGIRVSRLAQGVPLGGELEHTDQSTLAHAFGSRQPMT